ncbi:MAG: hypothetical protein PF482_14045 [Desulfobacteraceae bacterium]|nr:hypothetical protein [Desulfobacteraceae bacterium]
MPVAAIKYFLDKKRERFLKTDSRFFVYFTATPSKAFQKGILTNALSPHPYLFRLTVGAPIITKTMQQDILCVAGFISAFYTLLVGSKIVIAIISGKSRAFLTGRVYIYVMRGLGLILCVFTGLLVKDGLHLMG